MTNATRAEKIEAKRGAFIEWAMLAFGDCVEWDKCDRPYMAEDLRKGRPRQSLYTEWSAWMSALALPKDPTPGGAEAMREACADVAAGPFAAGSDMDSLTCAVILAGIESIPLPPPDAVQVAREAFCDAAVKWCKAWRTEHLDGTEEWHENCDHYRMKLLYAYDAAQQAGEVGDAS